MYDRGKNKIGSGGVHTSPPHIHPSIAIYLMIKGICTLNYIFISTYSGPGVCRWGGKSEIVGTQVWWSVNVDQMTGEGRDNFKLFYSIYCASGTCCRAPALSECDTEGGRGR